MIEILPQIAEMTKEVATAYILMYGGIEILKIIAASVLGYVGIKGFCEVIRALFEF